MKTIKGKIEFGAIAVTNNTDGDTMVDTEEFMSLSDEQTVDMVLLSKITEKQAAEFVAKRDGIGFCRYVEVGHLEPASIGWRYGLKTAKESLISLLKANDVLLEYGVSGFDGHNEYDKIEKQDYLLIKLT